MQKEITGQMLEQKALLSPEQQERFLDLIESAMTAGGAVRMRCGRTAADVRAAGAAAAARACPPRRPSGPRPTSRGGR